MINVGVGEWFGFVIDTYLSGKQEQIAKTVTTVPAVAFFDLRSFSEGGGGGWAY
jgi:hypothetical protein